MKKIILLSFVFIGLNVSAQTWERSESLPSSVDGRNHAVTFAIDGVGYLGLGYNRLDSTATYDDFYKFDPVTQAWSALPPFPGGTRGFSYAVATKDKAYVGFGLEIFRNPNNANQLLNQYKNDLWEYNPKTNAWRQLASCPCIARYHPAFIALDSQIFVGTGSSAQGNLNDWWEYNINQNTWVQRDFLPGVERHHPYYFGIDSVAYVGFGHGNGIFKDFYAFNANTSEWTKMNDFPGEARVAGTQFSHRGKGYVLSGQGNTHRNFPTGEFWQYDPPQDKWNQLPAHPGTGRWAPASIVIGDTVYFGTGQTTIEHDDFWKFPLPLVSYLGTDDVVDNVALVYPNPSQGKFKIADAVENFEVYDMSGMLIKRALNSGSLDLTDKPRGVYLIRLTIQGQVESQRIILE